LKKFSKATVLAAFLGAAFGAAAFAQTVPSSAATPAVRKAPELAFTVPGEGEKLLSQYRGKVVALEFILTTCPHCQASARVLSGLEQKYGSEGFQAIDVAINATDENRTPEQAGQLVTAFSHTYGASFPVGFVPRDEMTTFMGFSMVDRTVVPQVVLIDRKGFVHYQTNASGESDLRKPEVLEQKVQELLAQKDAASTRRGPNKLMAKRAS
jgi:thiol-disulfide isomerase/thioredoxin